MLCIGGQGINLGHGAVSAVPFPGKGHCHCRRSAHRAGSAAKSARALGLPLPPPVVDCGPGATQPAPAHCHGEMHTPGVNTQFAPLGWMPAGPARATLPHHQGSRPGSSARSAVRGPAGWSAQRSLPRATTWLLVVRHHLQEKGDPNTQPPP